MLIFRIIPGESFIGINPNIIDFGSFSSCSMEESFNLCCLYYPIYYEEDIQIKVCEV